MSKLITSWASGATSDYYGLYFNIQDNEFNECVISINNIWGTYVNFETISKISEKNYISKILEEGDDLENIFKDLDIMENSITFSLTKNSMIIKNGDIGENEIEDDLIYPAINNLRMRNQPSLTGEIVGYMENRIYQIIFIGAEAEIDGIKGNWLIIRPFNKNSISWVFSGYTRKPTKEEIRSLFGE